MNRETWTHGWKNDVDVQHREYKMPDETFVHVSFCRLCILIGKEYESEGAAYLHLLPDVVVVGLDVRDAALLQGHVQDVLRADGAVLEQALELLDTQVTVQRAGALVCHEAVQTKHAEVY